MADYINGRGGVPDATSPDRRVCGLHGVRDKNAVEDAVFRPQVGCYNSIEEEAAALMESLGNNDGFLDGNNTDVFLRRNDFYLDVNAPEAREFIDASMEHQEFSLPSNSRLDPPAHNTASLGFLARQSRISLGRLASVPVYDNGPRLFQKPGLCHVLLGCDLKTILSAAGAALIAPRNRSGSVLRNAVDQ